MLPQAWAKSRVNSVCAKPIPAANCRAKPPRRKVSASVGSSSNATKSQLSFGLEEGKHLLLKLWLAFAWLDWPAEIAQNRSTQVSDEPGLKYPGMSLPVSRFTAALN